jgi:hypothetical protein
MGTSVSTFSLASLLHSFLSWLHIHGVCFFGSFLCSLLNFHSLLFFLSTLGREKLHGMKQRGGQEKWYFLISV